jgi:hypothetical protein
MTAADTAGIRSPAAAGRAVEPPAASALGERLYFGKSADTDPAQVLVAVERLGPALPEVVGIAQEKVEKVLDLPRLLALRIRPHDTDHRPTRQGLRQRRHGQESCRTGEQEPSRRALLVDELLDGKEQRVTATLELVDDDQPRRGEHAPRVVSDRGQHRRLVQGEEVAAERLDDSAGERRLPALSRAVEDDGPEVAEIESAFRRDRVGVSQRSSRRFAG